LFYRSTVHFTVMQDHQGHRSKFPASEGWIEAGSPRSLIESLAGRPHKEQPAARVLLPSDFLEKPWNSIFQKSEHETIARNCMVILKRGGNEWRTLSEEEYVAARVEDGARPTTASAELSYFREVVAYTTSPEQAAKCSPTWAKII
jgi:hypothetical protein